MSEKIKNKVTFVGRPFPSSASDEQRSFAAAVQQMESDPTFQKFVTDNDLGKQRANLLVFGVEDFMFWYGVVLDHEVEVPSGLLKYGLPKAKVAEEELVDSNADIFSLPINTTIKEFLSKLDKEGIKYYQNLGDSDTPYILQVFDGNKKLTQTMYLQVSE